MLTPEARKIINSPEWERIRRVYRDLIFKYVPDGEPEKDEEGTSGSEPSLNRISAGSLSAEQLHDEETLRRWEQDSGLAHCTITSSHIPT